MAGRVLAIARREKSRAPMEEIESASVTTEAGVEGDSRGNPDERQVTVLTRESWQAACDELGKEIPWTTRRSNILIEGMRIEGQLGKTIRIGDLALQITGETDPCNRMEEQVAGLRQALTPDWRGGVTCRVMSSGQIAVGDAVDLEG
jgi:MOSC domain-containing protein YiiM